MTVNILETGVMFKADDQYVICRLNEIKKADVFCVIFSFVSLFQKDMKSCIIM